MMLMKGGIDIMFNKSFIIWILILLLPISIFAQEEKKGKSGYVKSLDLKWPFDQPSGLNNYAQELVFNKDKGLYHLEIAKNYYDIGYGLMERYQIKEDEYDLYIKDPYRIEVFSPYGMGMRQHFTLAEYWFLKSFDIVARYIKWDEQITSKQEYKTLLKNTFNNLLYTSIYNGCFHRAYTYLDEYKSFSSDPDFIEEWESKILGNIVKLHKKYDFAFTGVQSYDYLKIKHRELLIKIIERRYANQPKLKKELINRVYPELIIELEETSRETSESKTE